MIALERCWYRIRKRWTPNIVRQYYPKRPYKKNYDRQNYSKKKILTMWGIEYFILITTELRAYIIH